MELYVLIKKHYTNESVSEVLCVCPLDRILAEKLRETYQNEIDPEYNEYKVVMERATFKERLPEKATEPKYNLATRFRHNVNPDLTYKIYGIYPTPDGRNGGYVYLLKPFRNGIAEQEDTWLQIHIDSYLTPMESEQSE